MKIAKAYKKNKFFYTVERPPVKLESLEATPMRRSKLETYIDILNTLARLGPLKLTHIMYKANVNGSMLRGHLDFLIKQGLVEERTIKKRSTVFAVTQQGITVLKQLRELTQVLPIIEESQR